MIKIYNRKFLSLLLIMIVVFFQLGTPYSVEGETNIEESLSETTVPLKTNQVIELKNGLTILEETFMYGKLNKDKGTLSIELYGDAHEITVNSVDILEDFGEYPISENILDSLKSEMKVLPSGTEFYSLSTEGNVQLITHKQIELQIFTDTDYNEMLFLGNRMFLLQNELSDPEQNGFKEDVSDTVVDSEEQISEQVDKEDVKPSENLESEVEDILVRTEENELETPQVKPEIVNIELELNLWENNQSEYFEVPSDGLAIYAEKSGQSKVIGNLVKGQVYPILNDDGEWHRIQFSNSYGYVEKVKTIPLDSANIGNLNKNNQNRNRVLTALEDLTVYDNTSGQLIPYGTIKEGMSYPVASDYDVNWLRVIFADRVGYVYSKSASLSINKTDKYFKADANLDIYDNRTGSLVKVGELLQNQVYERVSDYGSNWHQIKYGNIYGYVYKPSTSFATGSQLGNLNTNNKSTGRNFKATDNLTVYDNSSGSLVPFGIIDKDSIYPIASDYGSNWWQIVLANRVGYIYKNAVDVDFMSTDKYFKADTDADVYDNRTGVLVKVGKLTENQVYQRVDDYGPNWHRIQFGDTYGYVYKPATSVATDSGLKNLNKNYSTTGRKFEVEEQVTVYDNTSGALVPFGVLDKGISYPIASDFSSNWWRIIFGDRVGYIYKDAVDIKFTHSDKYFKADTNIDIYDNRTGTLLKVGELVKDEVYERVSDYGKNWHQIHFGGSYGYVSKPHTSVATKNEVRNPNNSYTRDIGTFKANTRVDIYDNSTGKLIPFGTLEKDASLSIVTDFGNWWRVIFADRVGYVHKSAGTAEIDKTITIYLDPGHGGIPATGGNPGPVYRGVREQDLNLNISLQVRDRLEKLGYRVVMSRENDLNSYHNKWEPDLYARPAHANELGADILVSVHHNASGTWDSSMNGIETYIYGTNPKHPPLPENEDSHNNPHRVSESRKLADAIHKDLINNTGANDRGVKTGAFIAVREARMPAVLLELGYMSNRAELNKLTTNSYQQKLINGIVTGIHNYFLI